MKTRIVFLVGGGKGNLSVAVPDMPQPACAAITEAVTQNLALAIRSLTVRQKKAGTSSVTHQVP